MTKISKENNEYLENMPLDPKQGDQVHEIVSSDGEYYDDDYYENQPIESCPCCGRYYNDIDFDFQCCSKCGYDAEKEKHNPNLIRKPTDKDFMNGDADILTQEWY